MKRSSTLFLKAVIVLVAALALFIMVRFPQTEGRAANLDLVSIYTDPFILYCYVSSIPFFFALFQAIRLLSFVEKNKTFSKVAVNAVRNIKLCAFAIIGFILAGLVWIRLGSGEDDPAGAIAVGIVMTFASIVIATAAAVLQKVLQNAVDIKSENDLTV